MDQVSASKSQVTIIVILLALFLALFSYNTFAPRPPKPATQWEYRIQAIPDEHFEDSINKLGAQGWDLVFARRASNVEGDAATFSYEVIFKRLRVSGR